MRNIEKYKDIVLKNICACSIDTLLREKMIKGYCNGFNCEGCSERVLKWLLEETKETVLDEVERKYLSDVIKPFRENIEYIRKNKSAYIDKQFISIGFYDDDYMYFPFFENDAMYKCMELGRKYTLEELGL